MELKTEQIGEGVWYVCRLDDGEDAHSGPLMDPKSLLERQPVLIYTPKGRSLETIFHLGYDRFHIGSKDFLEDNDLTGMAFANAKRNLYAIIGATEIETKTPISITSGLMSPGTQVVSEGTAFFLRHGDIIHFFNELSGRFTFAYLGPASAWMPVAAPVVT